MQRLLKSLLYRQNQWSETRVNQSNKEQTKWLVLNSPERCTVATAVMTPGITDQTLWGLSGKLRAHCFASAAQQHGIKSTSWRERRSRMEKSISCKCPGLLKTDTPIPIHTTSLITRAHLVSLVSSNILPDKLHNLHYMSHYNQSIWPLLRL